MRPGVRRPVVYISLAAMIIGSSLVLTGALGLWDERARYEVGFGRSGDRCLGDDPGLTIDVGTGAELACGARSDYGDFSSKEAREVLALADRLAADGGLSASDQERIRELGRTISERDRSAPDNDASVVAAVVGAVVFGLGGLLIGGWMTRRRFFRSGRHSVRRRTT